MASRKEQKERLKAERLAREQELAAVQARRQRLSQLGGGALALVIIAAVVAAIASGGGSSYKPRLPSGGGPPIPAQKLSDLSAAAKEAGCVLNSYPNYGQDHTTATVHYKTNPP